MRKKCIQQRTPQGRLSDTNRLHPVVERVYRNRGLNSLRQCDYHLTELKPPVGMKDLAEAAKKLIEALKGSEKIGIVGDYDADGACSSALMTLGLRKLARLLGVDPELVVYVVPDRFEDGYGLSPRMLNRLSDHHPHWVVTVDNGITSFEGVDAAKDFGMGVIVTDHHLPSESLPNADYIDDPQRQDDTSGLENLAGVGVVFYLLLEIWRHLDPGEQEHFSVLEFIDIVALGTVADVVELDDNNRILVEQGLRRIRARRCRCFIDELVRLCVRNPAHLVEMDISFAIAPRLNAAGRVASIVTAVEGLISDDPEYARLCVEQLESYNIQRREIEARITERILEHIDAGDDLHDHGICVGDTSWHLGVVGIVASRLKERFQRPAIVFAGCGEGKLCGSARSIEGVHVRNVLAQVDAQYPDLIHSFGGHELAAGVSIDTDSLKAFHDAFTQTLAELYPQGLPPVPIYTDGELDPSEIDIDLAVALRQAGPWGKGFEPPLFEGLFNIEKADACSGGHLRLVLSDPRNSSYRWNAFSPQGLNRGYHYLDGPVRIVYSPNLNYFNGEYGLQLLVEHIDA